MPSASADATDSHAILHVLRNLVIAHDHSRVTQAATFPLNDEVPQRVAGLRNQFSARRIRSLAVAVVLAQGCERFLERAAGAAKRGGLFLRYFIVECVGNRRRTAAEEHHVPPI
jgi:hypothetical protein